MLDEAAREAKKRENPIMNKKKKKEMERKRKAFEKGTLCITNFLVACFTKAIIKALVNH